MLSLHSMVFAQPFGIAALNYHVIKMDYENSGGEKGSTFFKYNKQGILVKALWSLDNKSRYSINYYEHDLNGNIVTAFREFSDSLTSSELFIYDSEGNKISEQFYRSDSVSGSASYHYKDNHLVQADLKNYKGWINGTLKYQYNTKNNPVKGILAKDSKTICHIDYAYDDNGNLVKEFWNFNEKWSQTFYYFMLIRYCTSNYLPLQL